VANIKSQIKRNRQNQVRLAVKRLDSAAAKGIIHKNQAARRKSRLMARINKAGAES
jgi:small subunit ribosomal protein S20